MYCKVPGVAGQLAKHANLKVQYQIILSYGVANNTQIALNLSHQTIHECLYSTYIKIDNSTMQYYVLLRMHI